MDISNSFHNIQLVWEIQIGCMYKKTGYAFNGY